MSSLLNLHNLFVKNMSRLLVFTWLASLTEIFCVWTHFCRFNVVSIISLPVTWNIRSTEIPTMANYFIIFMSLGNVLFAFMKIIYLRKYIIFLCNLTHCNYILLNLRNFKFISGEKEKIYVTRLSRFLNKYVNIYKMLLCISVKQAHGKAGSSLKSRLLS